MQIFGGWIATLVVAGISAGLMTALLVYSPNKLMSDDRVYANKALNAETLLMVNLAGGATGPLGVSTFSSILCVFAWMFVHLIGSRHRMAVTAAIMLFSSSGLLTCAGRASVLDGAICALNIVCCDCKNIKNP